MDCKVEEEGDGDGGDRDMAIYMCDDAGVFSLRDVASFG